MRWAATWLNLRDRARAAFLRAADFPFAGAAFEDVAAEDFAAGFFAAVFFFLAGVVVVGVEGEASWAGVVPGKRTRARVRRTKYRKSILQKLCSTQRRLKRDEGSNRSRKRVVFGTLKTV